MSQAPATAREYLTPPAIAARLGVAPEKVIGWIRRGELPAFNLADGSSGRPRWHIAETDLELFLAGRAAKARQPTRRRRRKQATDIIEFF